jgi:hypothetical protein
MVCDEFCMLSSLTHPHGLISECPLLVSSPGSMACVYAEQKMVCEDIQVQSMAPTLFLPDHDNHLCTLHLERQRKDASFIKMEPIPKASTDSYPFDITVYLSMRSSGKSREQGVNF